MCNGDIFESYVEFLSTLKEVGPDAVADCFTLGDQFCGVELGDDGFEDFVADGREDSFIVVLTKILISLTSIKSTKAVRAYLVNLRQLLNLWSVQDSESQAHHLQVLATGGS